MITFWINSNGKDAYWWNAFAGNNRLLFGGNADAKQLRNCVNHIRSVTQHMKDGSYQIRLTISADTLRRKRHEKKWGVDR